MAKTQEELNDLKKEIEASNKKLVELTDEELAQVTGGAGNDKVIQLYTCYNPKCEHYGQPVSVAVGPPAANGKGFYYVCDFCSELITTPGGTPINFDVIT